MLHLLALAGVLAAAAAPVHVKILGEAEVVQLHRRRLALASNTSESAAAASAAAAAAALPNRRRVQVMEGTLVGNTEPLGYFYAQIHIGTPGQLFTVIVDTGSSLTAVPCAGCTRCGTHTNPYFDPAASSTYTDGCTAVPNCQACSSGHCTYGVSYVEGSSIDGHLALDEIGACGERLAFLSHLFSKWFERCFSYARSKQD